MNILIVGFGNVGRGLYAYLRPRLNDALIDKADPIGNLQPTADAYDVIHVTIPYDNDEQYLRALQAYDARALDSTIWILHSTINPHLLTQINEGPLHGHVYYSPIRNRERKMTEEMEVMQWLIATISTDQFHINGYLYMLDIDPIWFTDAKALAYGKLMETAWFGMNIAFAQMMAAWCEELEWDFEEAYTRYTELSRIGKDYRKEPVDYIPRPVFVPNEIKGKCVMQNLEIANYHSIISDDLYEFITNSNEATRQRLGYYE